MQCSLVLILITCYNKGSPIFSTVAANLLDEQRSEDHLGKVIEMSIE